MRLPSFFIGWLALEAGRNLGRHVARGAVACPAPAGQPHCRGRASHFFLSLAARSRRERLAVKNMLLRCTLAGAFAFIAAPAAFAQTAAVKPAAKPAAAAPKAGTPAPRPKAQPSSARAAAAPVVRQQGPVLRLEDYLRGRGEEFTAIDSNKDGSVSLQELTDREARVEAQRAISTYQKLFVELDVDRNGMLTQPEFMKMARPQAPKEQRPLLETMDSNRDGRISRSEWIVKMSTNFDRLDGNKDGVIDDNELARDQQRQKSLSTPGGR